MRRFLYNVGFYWFGLVWVKQYCAKKISSHPHFLTFYFQETRLLFRLPGQWFFRLFCSFLSLIFNLFLVPEAAEQWSMNDSSIKRHQSPGLNQCFVYIYRSAYQRTTLAKTHNLFPILYLNLQKMSNITVWQAKIFKSDSQKLGLSWHAEKKSRLYSIVQCHLFFFF